LNTAEFFETVKQQQEKGYTWHYVGEQLVPENTVEYTLEK
jgi:hypothetical protein